MASSPALGRPGEPPEIHLRIPGGRWASGMRAIRVSAIASREASPAGANQFEAPSPPDETTDLTTACGF